LTVKKMTSLSGVADDAMHDVGGNVDRLARLHELALSVTQAELQHALSLNFSAGRFRRGQ
jgi:hypothetical protein